MEQKKQFRKFICVLLCAVFVAGFGACASRQEQAAEDGTISTSSPEISSEGEESHSVSPTKELPDSSIFSPDNKASNTVRAVQGTVNSKAEIVKAYTEAYNKTKAAGTLFGTDSITILPNTLKLNGNPSSVVEKLINGNATKIFSRGNTAELPPAGASYQMCVLREEDVKVASMRENDTTLTLKIVPRDNGIPERGKGGSGNFTEVVSVDTIKELAAQQGVTFSEGKTFDDCVTLEYMGTESTIQIDKATGLITSAIYQSLIYVKAEQVNVAWFQNQSASATICYRLEFPSK